MRVVLFANTDWYLYNFRRSLATAIRDAGMEVILLSPAGPYGQKLVEMGFDWSPVPMRRSSLNPLREMSFVLWLANEFRKRRVDLVHGFTIKCAVYGALAARIAGAKAAVNAVAGMGYVFTSRDLKALVLRPMVRRIMSFTLAWHGSRLILQNPDDAKFFAEQGIVPSNLVRLILGSGVDCKRFFPRTDAREPGPLRVLLPARLVWDKGVGEYVEAARVVLRSRSDVQFLIAGTPDPHNPSSVPRATIDTWTSEGVIHCLGHVEDMAALFRAVDVVVLPSYREGLPKGLIEAAACECALVATDVPGCREVIDHEENGLLVPVQNALALADAIERLASDSALRKAFGRSARVKALERFDDQIVIRETLDVYSELLPQLT